MGLNKVKKGSNMYQWADYTWNVVRGRCPHKCNYCFMKRFWNMNESTSQRFAKKELNTDLGEDRIIFVGSSTDMFADAVPSDWIWDILTHCKCFDNEYLFQTKNPKKFLEFSFPKKSILGTTIETNWMSDGFNISKAPSVNERIIAMASLKGRKMVSIEPVMDFCTEEFVEAIQSIEPEFVSIGADSKGHNLPEPHPNKIEKLISNLEEFTKVYAKKNLKRITKREKL